MRIRNEISEEVKKAVETRVLILHHIPINVGIVKTTQHTFLDREALTHREQLDFFDNRIR